MKTGYLSRTENTLKPFFNIVVFRKWKGNEKPGKLIVRKNEYYPFTKNLWLRNFRRVK